MNQLYRKYCRSLLAFSFFGCLIFNSVACVRLSVADDWPRWLNAKSDSIWREDGILTSFPEKGPPLRWSAKLGGGYSGPAVAKGYVVVMDFVEDPQSGPRKNLNKGEIPKNQNFVRELQKGVERVHCFRESNGEPVWVKEYRCDYTSVSTYAIGPRCTPTIDGDRVYTLGAEGHLNCYALGTGKKIWSTEFVKDFGLSVPEWGVAGHPLIDGDQLICIVGGSSSVSRNSLVVSFDKRTGKKLWQALEAPQPGYCAPVILTIAGTRHLVIWHSSAVVGLNPKTGKTLWTQSFSSTFAMSIGIPRVQDNRVFVMCFAGKSLAFDIQKEQGASSDWATNIAWQGNRKTGIDGVMNTPFIKDGFIYGCGNGGRYTCARLSDGKQMWTTFSPAGAKRPIPWGNVFTVQHQDRYFLSNDQGELIIAKMSPTEYREISRAKLIEPTHRVSNRLLVWSHPAFANRSVYLRNDREIKVYSLAAQATE